MNRRFALSVSLAAALLASCNTTTEKGLIAIVGATLIDGTGAAPLQDAVIIVSGNRIRHAGPRATTPIPAGAEKINAMGKFVTPGLIDLHVHLGATGGPGFRAEDYTRERVEKNLNSYLYFGVTTVRSVGTERDAGFSVRREQREGKLKTAQLFTAGRGFTATGGHPSQEIGAIARQVDTPEEARRQVSELAAQQVDLIKIWVDDLGGGAPKIKREVNAAIIDEARKHQIPVIAHIHYMADTRALFEDGAAGFLHMVQDTETLDPAFLVKLKAQQVVFAPTLIRQELGWYFKEHPEALDAPDAVKVLAPATAQAIKEDAAKAKPSAAARKDFDAASRNTKRMYDAGVPIGVGSDGGSASDVAGLLTHREIELLVACGLTPMEAIVAATRNGALALKKLDEFGTIAPGKRADLLLLNENPLENVRNLRKLERVMLGGEWVDRPALSLY